MRGEYKVKDLIDEMKKHFGVMTYAALAKELQITEGTMGLIARGMCPIGAHYLLRIHEATGWNIAYIRHVMGDESEMPFNKPRGKPGAFYWDDLEEPRR